VLAIPVVHLEHARPLCLVVARSKRGREPWYLLTSDPITARAVNEDAKPHGGLSRCRSHDQMQIAGVEAVRDTPVGRVQHCGLPLHRPITR